MAVYDPEFLPIMRIFDLDQQDLHTATIYGVWPDLRLAYFNQGWFEFARANNGEPAISQRFGLGADLLQAITEPLRGFYRDLYSRAFQSAVPLEHDYECPSPELYRKYHQRIHPLDHRQGLLIVNSLLVERPHDLPVHVFESQFLRPDGSVVQCAHCRRIRRVALPIWDWVPDLVAHPHHPTSHGICEFCLEYFYPWLRDSE